MRRSRCTGALALAALLVACHEEGLEYPASAPNAQLLTSFAGYGAQEATIAPFGDNSVHLVVKQSSESNVKTIIVHNCGRLSKLGTTLQIDVKGYLLFSDLNSETYQDDTKCEWHQILYFGERTDKYGYNVTPVQISFNNTMNFMVAYGGETYLGQPLSEKRESQQRLTKLVIDGSYTRD